MEQQIDPEIVRRIFAEAQKGKEYLSQYGRVLPGWEELQRDWSVEFPDRGNGIINKHEPNLPDSKTLPTRLWYNINEAEDWMEFKQAGADLTVRLIERDSDKPEKPELRLATPGGFKKPGLAPGESGIAEYEEESTVFSPRHKQYVAQGLKERRAIPVYIGYGHGDPGNRSDKIVVTTAFALLVPSEIADESELRKVDQPEDPDEKPNALNARDVSLREILEGGPEKFWSPLHYYLLIMIGAAEILKQLGYKP